MKKNIGESQVINFGCRLNAYEAEVIKNLIKQNKINNTLIFNTCAVTHEAEKQAQQTIRKYHKNFPDKKIIVTGCASQISPEKFSSMDGVTSVIGNYEKLENHTWANLEKNNYNQVNNIMKIKKTSKYVVENFDGKARAYVEIQQGCDHRCTFCVIPYGRGNNRSIPIGLVLKRIKKLVSNGFNEVVLTGVDITNYGVDLPGQPTLAQLIKRLLKLTPDLKQLRLSSIDCAEINYEFFDLIQYEERLMPHLHISIQAGNNIILKRMKRRHNREQVINFCQKIKKLRPNIVFGADLIAGFPTENNSMFNNTCELIEECDLTYLHVFPYSQRPGTPASKMPQVSNKIKKVRAKILREIGEKQLSKYLKTLIGKEKTILIEKNYQDYSIGKTQEYTPVKINKILKEGEIYNFIVKSENSRLLLA